MGTNQSDQDQIQTTVPLENQVINTNVQQNQPEFIKNALAEFEAAQKTQEQLRLQALTEADNNRIYASALKQTTQTFGDSKEMKKVKKGLEKVDDNLRALGGYSFTEEDFTRFRSDYFDAIESCRKFLESYNPSSQKGVERKMLVEKNMNRLIGEVQLLGQAQELIGAGRLICGDEVNDEFSLKELLVRARVFELGTVPGMKLTAEKDVTEKISDPSISKVLSLVDPVPSKFKSKKQAKIFGKDLGILRRSLKTIPSGRSYTAYVNLSEGQFTISQDEKGVITINSKSGSAVIKETAYDLLRMLDSKMIEENANVEKDDLEEMLRDQKDYAISQGEIGIIAEKTLGTVQSAGTKLARFLELKTGKPATFFSNLNASTLRMLSIRVMEGLKSEELVDLVRQLERENELVKSRVNTSETLDLVKSLSMQDAVETQKIEMPRQQVKDDGWQDEERATRDLVADMIYSEDTWDNDETITEPGERMRRTLLKHSDILATLIVDSYRENQNEPSILDRAIDKLPLDTIPEEETKDAKKDLKETIKAQLKKMTDLLDKSIDDASFALKIFGNDAADQFNDESHDQAEAIKHDKTETLRMLDIVLNPQNFMQYRALMKGLVEIENDIDDNVEEFTYQIQSKINKSVGTVFGGGKKESTDTKKDTERFVEIITQEDIERVRAQETKKDTKQTVEQKKAEQKKAEKKEAERKAAEKKEAEKKEAERKAAEQKAAEDAYKQHIDSMNPNVDGLLPEEKKLRVILGDKELTKILQDSMKGESGQGLFIKNVFREYFVGVSKLDRRSMLGSAIRSAGANPTEGQFLGGLLKGAGPLFQKMMQGLPLEGMPEELREALSDMKSKLAPIPESIVKAQLLGMVERSNGRIERIEVTRALGAASVGQTFLCKMYGPDLPQEGKPVVVKLLKPDVRNRMMREKNIMLHCATKTDKTGGMKATYLGQLERIEEELDLTIEARNVIKGSIYDKPMEGREVDGVKSMKLETMVDPTINSMMLEMAPGTTVDRYIQELKEKQAGLVDVLAVREDEKAPAEKSRPKYDEKLSKEENEAKMKAALENETRLNEKKKKYRDRITKVYEDYIQDLKNAITRQKYLASLADKWVSEGIFGEGFYHGDLHAGNIMINDDGLTVIDFGNATTLDENQKTQVTRMVGAAAVGDVEGFREGLHKLLKPEFEDQFKKQKTKLTDQLKLIFSLGDKNSAGQRIAVALMKAQELGLEVPSAIFNFSQCQLRIQNAIDELNTQIDQMKKNLYLFDLPLGNANSYDLDLYGETLLSIGSINGFTPPRTVEESMEQHHKKGTGAYLSKYQGDDVQIERKQIENNEVYDKFKQFENGEGTIVDLTKDAFAPEMKRLFKNLNTADHLETSKIKNTVIGILTAFKDFMDIESIAAYFVHQLTEEYSDKENHPYPTEADKKLVQSTENILQNVSDRIKLVIDSCKALQADKKEGADQSKIDEDVKAVEKAYIDVYILNCLYMDNNAISEFSRRLAKESNDHNTDAMIKETASYDEELGKKLLEDYEAFKTFKHEHPGEMLYGTKEIEKVLRDAMSITAKRMTEISKNMAYINDEEPESFVDVMGGTILRNLATSLKRLGFWASLTYTKKLEM